MKIKKSFQLALNILIHSKLRSWLTIIGIVIGIAAVVAIVSISEGAKQSLEERLSGLGADIITVTPGFSQASGRSGGFRGPGGGNNNVAASQEDAKNLTSKDVLVINSIDNVDLVMGIVSDRGKLTYSSKSSTVSVQGVDPRIFKDITTEDIAQGRFLTISDSFSVVLGGNIIEKTFDGEIPLNSNVIIEERSFKVVGITEEGNTAYIPEEIARSIFDDIGEKEYDSISVKVIDVEISENTSELIDNKLMLSRGILFEKDKDFTISSSRSFQETITSSLNTISLFLGAIAAISLLVGGIGIANTMFTSVLEKTKEIGIMKAIGAKNSDILTIFIINSGLIGLVGGIGGVILGTITSNIIGSMGGIGGSNGGGFTRMFSQTLITPELIIFSLLFSVIIGMIAGVVPAYRASKLKPVDALRYE